MSRYSSGVIDLVSSESEQSDGGNDSDVEMISQTPRTLAPRPTAGGSAVTSTTSAASSLSSSTNSLKRSLDAVTSSSTTTPSNKRTALGASATTPAAAIGIASVSVKQEPVGVGFGEADVGDEIVELRLPLKTPAATGASRRGNTPATAGDLAVRLGAAGEGTDLNDSDEEEIAFVGGNMAVMSEMAHQRESCSKFPFDRLFFKQEINIKHCDNCYCYVCDSPVADCMDWSKHCQATMKVQSWRTLKADMSKQMKDMQFLVQLIPDKVQRAAYLKDNSGVLRSCSDFRGVDDLLAGRDHPPLPSLSLTARGGSHGHGYSGYDGDEDDYYYRSLLSISRSNLEMVRQRRINTLNTLSTRIAVLVNSDLDAAGLRQAVALMCEWLAVCSSEDATYVVPLSSHIMKVLMHFHCNLQLSEIVCRCLLKSCIWSQANLLLRTLVSLYPNGMAFAWLYESSEPVPVGVKNMALKPLSDLLIEVHTIRDVLSKCRDGVAGCSSSSSSSGGILAPKPTYDIRSDFHDAVLSALLESEPVTNRLFGVYSTMLNSSTMTKYATKVTAIMVELQSTMASNPDAVADDQTFISSSTMGYFAIAINNDAGAGGSSSGTASIIEPANTNVCLGVPRAMLLYMKLILMYQLPLRLLRSCLASDKYLNRFTALKYEHSTYAALSQDIAAQLSLFRDAVSLDEWAKKFDQDVLVDQDISRGYADSITCTNVIRLTSFYVLFYCCATVPGFAATTVVRYGNGNARTSAPITDSFTRVPNCSYVLGFVVYATYQVGLLSQLDGVLSAYLNFKHLYSDELTAVTSETVKALSNIDAHYQQDSRPRVYFDDDDVVAWRVRKQFLTFATIQKFVDLGYRSAQREKKPSVLFLSQLMPAFVKCFWSEIFTYFEQPDTDKDDGVLRFRFFSYATKLFWCLDVVNDTVLSGQGKAVWAYENQFVAVSLEACSQLDFDRNGLSLLKHCPSFGIVLYVGLMFQIRRYMKNGDASFADAWMKLLPRVVVALKRFVFSTWFDTNSGCGMSKGKSNCPNSSGSSTAGNGGTSSNVASNFSVAIAAWKMWLPIIKMLCPAVSEELWNGKDFYSKPPRFMRQGLLTVNDLTLRVLYDQPMLLPGTVVPLNSSTATAAATSLFSKFNIAVMDLARVHLNTEALTDIAKAFVSFASAKYVTSMLIATVLDARPELFVAMKKRNLSGLCAVALSSMSPELIGFVLRSMPVNTTAVTDADTDDDNTAVGHTKAVRRRISAMSYDREVPYTVPVEDGTTTGTTNGNNLAVVDLNAKIALFRSDVIKNAKALTVSTLNASSDGLRTNDKMLLIAMLGDTVDLMKELTVLRSLYGESTVQGPAVDQVSGTQRVDLLSLHSVKCSRGKCKTECRSDAQRGSMYTCLRCQSPAYCCERCALKDHRAHTAVCTGRDAPAHSAKEYKHAVALECLFNAVFSIDDVYASMERVLPVAIEELLLMSLWRQETSRFKDFMCKLLGALQKLDAGRLSVEVKLCIRIVAMLCDTCLATMKSVLDLLVETTTADTEFERKYAQAGLKRVLLWIKAAYESGSKKSVPLAATSTKIAATAATSSAYSLSLPLSTSSVVAVASSAGVVPERLTGDPVSSVSLYDYFFIVTQYFDKYLPESSGTEVETLLVEMESLYFPIGWEERDPAHVVYISSAPELDPMQLIEKLCGMAVPGSEHLLHQLLRTLVCLLLLSPQSPCVCAVSGLHVPDSGFGSNSTDTDSAISYLQEVAEKRRRVKTLVSLHRLKEVAEAWTGGNRVHAHDKGRNAAAAAAAAALSIGNSDGSVVRSLSRRELLNVLSLHDLLYLLEFVLAPTLTTYREMTTTPSPTTTTTDDNDVIPPPRSSASRLMFDDANDSPDFHRLSLLAPKLFNQVVFYSVIFEPSEPTMFVTVALQSRDIAMLINTINYYHRAITNSLSVASAEVLQTDSRYIAALTSAITCNHLQLPVENQGLLTRASGTGSSNIRAATNGADVAAVSWEWEDVQREMFGEATLLGQFVLLLVRISSSPTGAGTCSFVSLRQIKEKEQEVSALCSKACGRIADLLFPATTTSTAMPMLERTAMVLCLKASLSFSIADIVACSQLQPFSHASSSTNGAALRMNRLAALVVPADTDDSMASTILTPVAPSSWSFSEVFVGMTLVICRARSGGASNISHHDTHSSNHSSPLRILGPLEVILSLLHGVELNPVTSADGSVAYLRGERVVVAASLECWDKVLECLWQSVSNDLYACAPWTHQSEKDLMRANCSRISNLLKTCADIGVGTSGIGMNAALGKIITAHALKLFAFSHVSTVPSHVYGSLQPLFNELLKYCCAFDNNDIESVRSHPYFFLSVIPVMIDQVQNHGAFELSAENFLLAMKSAQHYCLLRAWSAHVINIATMSVESTHSTLPVRSAFNVVSDKLTAHLTQLLSLAAVALVAYAKTKSTTTTTAAASTFASAAVVFDGATMKEPTGIPSCSSEKSDYLRLAQELMALTRHPLFATHISCRDINVRHIALKMADQTITEFIPVKLYGQVPETPPLPRAVKVAHMALLIAHFYDTYFNDFALHLVKSNVPHLVPIASQVLYLLVTNRYHGADTAEGFNSSSSSSDVSKEPPFRYFIDLSASLWREAGDSPSRRGLLTVVTFISKLFEEYLNLLAKSMSNTVTASIRGHLGDVLSKLRELFFHVITCADTTASSSSSSSSSTDSILAADVREANRAMTTMSSKLRSVWVSTWYRFMAMVIDKAKPKPQVKKTLAALQDALLPVLS